MSNDQQVKNIVAHIIGQNVIETTSIKNVDELDLFEILMELEYTLDIDIPDDEYKLVTTVGELIDLVNKVMKQ